MNNMMRKIGNSLMAISMTFSLLFSTPFMNMTIFGEEVVDVVDSELRTELEDFITLNDLTSLSNEDNTYTQESWQEFATALQEALNLLEAPQASDDEYSIAYDNLSIAFDALKKVVKKVNLALNATVEASTNSAKQDVMNDGNHDTIWNASGNNVTATFTLDETKASLISEINVIFGSDQPSSYSISVSNDGEHWVEVSKNMPTNIFASPYAVSQVRISSKGNISIKELEIQGYAFDELYVSTIADSKSVYVEYGTLEKNLQLPEIYKVEVMDSDSTYVVNMIVGDWYCEDYVATTVGDYDFNGTISLPPNVIDEEGFSALCIVSVYAKEVDFEPLNQKIAEANEIINDPARTFTSSSKNALTSTIMNVSELENNSNATTADIIQAINMIDEKLEVLVETTALTKILEDANKKQESDFTASSWKQFVTCLEAGNRVANDPYASQDAVNIAYTDLSTILDNMDTVGDTTQLEKLVASCENYNEADYDEETWSDFASALAQAQEIIANKENELQEDIDMAYEALNEALLTLSANKSLLIEKVNEGNALLNDTTHQYSVSSKTNLNTKVQAGQTLIDTDNVLPESIRNAIQELEDAIDNLVDITSLVTALEEVNSLTSQSYTTTSWNRFEIVKNQAIQTKNKDTLTASEVEQAISNLNSAKLNLQKHGDPTGLQNKITQAENTYQQSAYTAITWATYSEQLDLAKKAIINAQDMTQQQFDEVSTALDEAIAGLEEKEVDVLDFSLLQSRVDQAKAIDRNRKDRDTLDVLDDARRNGEAIIKRGNNATQDEIDQAATTLLDAINDVRLEDIIESDLINTSADSYIRIESVSSQMDKDGTNALGGKAQYVLDYDEETYWTTDWSDQSLSLPQYIEFDLGESYLIDDITFLAKMGADSDGDIFKCEVFTKAGPDAEYYSIGVYTFENDGAHLTDRDQYKRIPILNYTEARYIKIVVTESGSASQINKWVSMSEIRFYGMGEVEPAETSDLEKIISDCEQYLEEQYTASSYTALVNALEKGTDVLYYDYSTQEEVDEAIKLIEEKVEGLVSIVALQEAYEVAENTETEGMRVDSIQALNQAITQAQQVLENPNASAQEVAQQVKALQDAIKNLKVDTTILDQAIQNASAYKQEDYTVATWKILNEKVQLATNLKSKENLTKTEVDQAIKDIDQAITSLEVDKTELNALIQELSKYQENDFLSTSWRPFQIAMQNAKLFATTPQDVINSIIELKNTSAALVEKGAGNVEKLTATNNTYNSVKLTWKAVEDASSYDIYYSTSKNGQYKYNRSVTTNNAVVNKLVTKTKYYFKVRAVKTSKFDPTKQMIGKESNIASATPDFTKAPILASVKQKTYGTLQITWKGMAGASYYLLERREEGSKKWVFLKTFRSNVRTAESRSLKTGKKYYYRIRARRYSGDDAVYSGYSQEMSNTPVLKTTKLSISKRSSTSARLSWKTVSGANGYEVYRKVGSSGSYKKIKTTKEKEKSMVSKSLVKGKRYYYKVRAYRMVSGKKVYSKYSSEVSYKA